MAEGKWISGLTATTPVAEAARRALSIRFEVVRSHLHLALTESDKDSEHVHQLRVGTRRATAALDIFADCLPAKVYRTARKQLRRIRRAAGAARDWDVFRMTVQDRPRRRTDNQQPGVDLLIGYTLAQRDIAQQHLETAATGVDLARLASAAVTAVSDPGGERPLLDLARLMLRQLLGELDRVVAADLSDYDNLHQVRIAGKRLRYAMEVFADCFPPPFRQTIYPAVEEMQEILGAANDSHVAGQRLGELRDRLRAVLPAEWPRWKPGVNALRRFHQRRLPQQRRLFLEWWERWQTSGTAAALADLLKK